MLRLYTAFQSRFIREEEGATAVEYALMVALIAVVIIAAVTALGLGIQGTFFNVSGQVGGAAS